MSAKREKKALAAAGILAPERKMGPEELAARLAQRATTVPNKRRVEARKAARGGTARWSRAF